MTSPTPTPTTTTIAPPAAQRGPLTRFAEALGTPVVGGYRAARDLAGLFVDTFVAIVRGRASRREVFVQAYEIGEREKWIQYSSDIAGA